MPKIYKPGKVALVLSGRFAGRKVIVIRQSDEGTKVRWILWIDMKTKENYRKRRKTVNFWIEGNELTLSLAAFTLIGTTLPSRHCCWYWKIPKKGYKRNGKEANGEEKQG